MKSKFSNNLVEAELERLVILAEECSEVQQIVCKIIRHGFESHNPHDDNRTTNRELLEKELGDLLYAIDLLFNNRDVNDLTVSGHEISAPIRKKPYLHHQ